jgi:hypothetical protein
MEILLFLNLFSPTLFHITSFWHTSCGVGAISFNLCEGDNTLECDFVGKNNGVSVCGNFVVEKIVVGLLSSAN